MAGELELIERIRRALPWRGESLRLGIGDDAALLRPPRGRELVVSCDAFLENVHFLARVHPPEAVGYKALARAASDLAAMGATPHSFLFSLALPAARTGRWLNRFLNGLARAARRFGFALAGGDLSAQPSIAISVTVIGTAAPGCAVLRGGARPGDVIFVSGTLGRGQLGLELVLRGLSQRARWKRFLRPHFYPEPRLALGEWLARGHLASALIDLSDGLSTDLDNLCRASRVGACIWLAKLPTVPLPGGLSRLRLDAEKLAMDGGEDYELLFTVPARKRQRVPRQYEGVALHEIGIITARCGLFLAGPDGKARPLLGRGWDPFVRRKRK